MLLILSKEQYIGVRYLKCERKFRSKLDDSNKIKLFLKNNELDLERIVEGYTPYISKIIDNMGRDFLNEEDKEDIISDVFFILWNNKNKLDKDKSMSAYLAGVTKNVSHDYLRKLIKKKKINVDISDYDNNLYDFDKIEILDDNIERIKSIEKRLYKMKDLDRLIFIDFYYNSKSIKDIAKEQRISEFNVKQRLYRIRNRIRKEVK